MTAQFTGLCQMVNIVGQNQSSGAQGFRKAFSTPERPADGLKGGY